MKKTNKNHDFSEHFGHHEAKVGSERSFGLVFAIVFAIIGLLPLIKGGELRFWSLLVTAAFLGLGVLAPATLRPLNIIWFKAGLLLGRIITPVVISLLFFCSCDADRIYPAHASWRPFIAQVWPQCQELLGHPQQVRKSDGINEKPVLRSICRFWLNCGVS